MQYRRKPNKVQAIQLTQDLWVPGETSKPIAPKGCWLITDPIKGQFFMTDELFKEEYELDLPLATPTFPIKPFGQEGLRVINAPIQTPYVNPYNPYEVTCQNGQLGSSGEL